MALRSINPEPSAIGNDGLRTFNTTYEKLGLRQKSRRVVLSKIYDHVLADDIASEAWLRIAKVIIKDPSYIRDPELTESIVIRTVSRLCTDFIRRKSICSFRRLQEVDCDDFLVQDRPQVMEDMTPLYRAVATLPLAYREAVVLCDLQGMTAGEAADCLSVTKSALKSRLHRGRSLLRGDTALSKLFMS